MGNTPLHCAAYRGQKQCIIKLLKSGASPCIKNSNGTSLNFKDHLLFSPVYCTIIYCMADCVADQTALDLIRSDELRLILAAYQVKVRTDELILWHFPLSRRKTWGTGTEIEVQQDIFSFLPCKNICACTVSWCHSVQLPALHHILNLVSESWSTRTISIYFSDLLNSTITTIGPESSNES